MPEQDELTIEMEPVRPVTAEQASAYFDARQKGLSPDEAWQSAELADRTNQFLQRAADRADDDRNEDFKQRELFRESSAFHGGWIPGGATDAQRQELADAYVSRRTISETWLEQESARILAFPERARLSTDEIPLAEAYYNGRREAFNSARTDFLANNPERANEVPAAIEIQEIRVRQRVLEVEPEGRSMEFAS